MDKIDLHKEKDWNEFLRLIGIANMNFQKKERNIKDEVLASQGGTVASRFSRFQPRQNAIDEINKKFENVLLENGEKALPKKLEVSYYDGLPTTEETEEKELEEEERTEEKQDAKETEDQKTEEQKPAALKQENKAEEAKEERKMGKSFSSRRSTSP